GHSPFLHFGIIGTREGKTNRQGRNPVKFGANGLEVVEFQRTQIPKLHPQIPIWDLDAKVLAEHFGIIGTREGKTNRQGRNPLKFGANGLEVVEFQRTQIPKLHPHIPIWDLDAKVLAKHFGIIGTREGNTNRQGRNPVKFGANGLEVVEFQRTQNSITHSNLGPR
ncbi:hypothetical protein AVEN_224260-1, partial [Araneus ventricosus]